MAKSRRGADQGADQSGGQNANGGELRYDDFIRQIRPRPESTDPVTLLHGYVGESTTEDKIRLYGDASLASYVEIAIADILFSLPNEDDPLGGSRIWVKQNANAQYNEASSFAQGDMYNDYMSNAYTPGGYGNMDAGAAVSVGQLACPVAISRGIICGPSRYICPTPASQLIICFSRPIWQCGIKSINRPCIPVTCQVQTRFPTFPPVSYAGCPSGFCTPGGGFPIDQGIGGGGGFMNDPYGNYSGGANYGGGGFNDYTGGDMYNDYMTNQYEGNTGYGAFGPQANTLPPQCVPQASAFVVCPTRQLSCSTLKPYCIQFKTTNFPCNTIICPTRNIRLCITPNRIMSICRPCWVTPPTVPPQGPGPLNPGGPIAGGGGFMNDPYGGYAGGDPYAAGYGDYAGGEMYDDYMNNAYYGGAGNFGPQAAVRTITYPCRTRNVAVCPEPTDPPRCPTNNPHVPMCDPRYTRRCPFNFAGGMNNPYGY